jgi:hypothetical protein
MYRSFLFLTAALLGTTVALVQHQSLVKINCRLGLRLMENVPGKTSFIQMAKGLSNLRNIGSIGCY